MKNNVILPNWEYVASPRRLLLPRKFKIFYYLAIVALVAFVACIALEFWNIRTQVVSKAALNDQLQQANSQAISIDKQNKNLNQLEDQFNYIYPYISNRYSVSQIYSTLADKHILPESAYFSLLDLELDKDGSLDTTVNLVSNSKQLSIASQDMDALRSGVTQLLSTARENTLVSEYRLQAYNALGDPIARSSDANTSGFQVSEVWKFSVTPLPKDETIRLYEILRTTHPIKQPVKTK